MNLEKLLQNGVSQILTRAGRFYLSSQKGLAFLKAALLQNKQSALLRKQYATGELSIPVFLIASVASQCNLYCAGCYARAGSVCAEGEKTDLTATEWEKIFNDAASLGVSFVLLAGGEPFTRRDVLAVAAKHPGLIFPVFTNGTLLTEADLALFHENRHMIPIFSIEGGPEATDNRRGAGAHAKVAEAMAWLAKKRVLFGVSITVTKQNLPEVLAESFVNGLRQKGCGLILYVEYVPLQAGSGPLALSPAESQALLEGGKSLKKRLGDTVVLTFPGDEAAMGGCLASGRGFFHINPKGDAEPCPFSPYAEYNLKTHSILQILQSPYYAKLRTLAAEAGPHTGGCVLHKHEAEVRALLAEE